MWTLVVPADLDIAAPSTRSKHSATLIGDEVYVLGGRNGNLPMRDFWKYNLVTGKWQLLKPSGEKLPLLQEHSAVAYKNCIYIFGGEVSFSAASETPLWRYDIGKNLWKKIRSKKGVATPKGRRGHSALIHRGSMIIYGGYQDLRGSSNELWVFHFETESWHCISMATKIQNSELPPPRHKHSAVIHDDAMWIYGGMTDLQERGDLWKWDTLSKTWTNIKTKINPGPLHSHAVCRLPSAMLLFGGERNGHPINELWKFNFSVDTWEKVTILGSKPQPRSESIAFSVSELRLKDLPDTERTCRVRYRTSNSADRNSRHSSYLPNNRIVPCEKTYVFQPSPTNYTDGSDIAQQYAETRCTRNILQDISKISQIKILNNKCSYTVLNGVTTESTESLLNTHVSFSNNEDLVSEGESTPSRLVKSKSAFVIKKNTLTEPDESIVQKPGKIPHEPFSVPNISSLALPKLSLTPVEVAKLVYLDTDDENEFSNYDSLQKSNPSNLMYDCFAIRKEESYSSHLAYADNPLYQHMMKTNTGKDNISLTSDYASFETVNHHSSSSNYSVKTRDTEGPFGFCNPNYLGPDIKGLQNNKQKEADCELSNSNECLELQDYNGINKNTKVYYKPSGPRLKTRACSASRAEDNHVDISEKKVEDVGDTFIPLNIYVVGGKEHGQVTVFKRPISIWKLKLF